MPIFLEEQLLKQYGMKKPKAIKKALDKVSNESMVGKLKRLVREPKRDVWGDFKKQHKIK